MGQDKVGGDTPPRPGKPPSKPQRLAREAAALRANLHKRKQQARAQAERPAPAKG